MIYAWKVDAFLFYYIRGAENEQLPGTMMMLCLLC